MLPALVLALGFLDLWTWAPPMRSTIVQRMDDEMASVQPDLVLVGNSELNFGIDAERLGEALDLKVAKLSADGTAMPYWYAVVKNRVFGAGHRPRFVLVMADAPRLLQSRASATQSSVLFEQLEATEVVIGRKVFGNSDGSILGARLRAQRAEKRDALVEPLRDGLVGLIWGEGDLRARVEAGARRVEAAGEVVFDPGKAVDMDLHQRVIPVAQRQEGSEGGADADASLVSDLIELTTAHDAKLVVLRAPLRSDNPALRVAPEVEARLTALLQEAGIPQIPYAPGELPDEAFVDMWHVHADHQVAYTETLADRLRELGVHGESSG